VIEVNHLCLDSGTILHWLIHPNGKFSLVLLSTLWAGLDFSLVFGHLYLHWRKVENLTPFMRLDYYSLEIMIALLTASHPVDLDFIRVGTHLQRMPLMSRLPAAFATAGLPQTASAGFLHPIARGRLAAVLAVFRQLVFQRLDPLFQLGYRFLLLLHNFPLL
jgi:hypothetical protein